MCATNDDWICLAQRDQIDPDNPLTIVQGMNGVGLYEVEDQLYALEDVCPHGASLLSQGFLWKGMVKCALHGAVFDIKTGKCLQGPAERDLETYPVQIRGNDVYVQIEPE